MIMNDQEKKGLLQIKGTEYDVNCEKTNMRLIATEVTIKGPIQFALWGLDEHGKEVSVYASEARVSHKNTLEYSKFTVTSNKIDLDNDILVFRLYQVRNQV
jgi:hypothetical protein